MLIIRSLLVTVLLLGAGRACNQSAGDCVFNLDSDSPRFPSHLIDPDHMTIIKPSLVNGKRILCLPTGKKLTVTCQGDNKNVLTATNDSFNTASCQSSSIKIGRQSFSYSSLGCKTQVKEAVTEGGKCSTAGELINIGWQVGESFVNQITICHDLATANSLYATSVIQGASILADDESNRRPSFRRGSYFNGIDAEKAYTKKEQKSTLKRILGSDAQADKFLIPSKSFFFARGHLAPDGDFVDAASQDASYYYVNVAPQWQSFNNGNWKALESIVRNLAAQRRADYTVTTGTHGILTLADSQGKQRPIYLAFDENNNGLIPVPKFFWKVVYDPLAGQATAIVGINNPHLTNITKTDVICPDVCSQVSWITFQRTKMTSGYTFCCTVAQLKKAIPTAPDLGDLPLLL